MSHNVNHTNAQFATSINPALANTTLVPPDLRTPFGNSLTGTGGDTPITPGQQAQNAVGGPAVTGGIPIQGQNGPPFPGLDTTNPFGFSSKGAPGTANFLDFLPTFQAAFPNQPLDPRNSTFRPDNRASLIEAFFGGPLFSNDPLGLPGGGAGINAALGIDLGQALEGAARGVETDQLLRDLQLNALNSSQNRANEAVSGAAFNLVDPGAQGSRFRDLEREAREQSALSLNNARNRLQDLGMAGQGLGQAPALIAAEAQNAANLQDTLLQLANFKADEERRNLEAATGALGQSTDIRRSLIDNPALLLAQQLSGPQNKALGQFRDDLFGAGQIVAGQDARGGNSVFQDVAPLLGGLISGAGNAGGLGKLLGGFT
jgi:hypothetical protein